jgi:hypothetical protein
MFVFGSYLLQNYVLLNTSTKCLMLRVVIGSCENDKKHINDSAGKHNRRNHDNPAHRPRNHTLYDIPPIRFVFQVTRKDLRISLMLAKHLGASM